MKRILITLLCLCFCGMMAAQTDTTPADKPAKAKTEKHNKGNSNLEPISLTQEEFAKKVLAVASGEKAKNELSGAQGIAIFKDGVTL